MKHNKELDQILQEALSPDKEPSEWLNQKILRRAKETNNMDKKLKRRIPAAAFATALALSVGSVSVLAAWNYLTPDKVAEVMEDEGLMEAFKSKDAITVNESQTYGDLKITVLGIVSGKDLSKFVVEGGLNESKTYVVTAIENVDGTPIDFEKSSDVIVSPLVKGLKPWQCNVYTMGGGSSATIENGIEYRITECDSVEMFADKGLYISVSDSVPGSDNYQYNEKTGEITRNESYKGINGLFNLPIDKSKADPKAAEKYLKEMEEAMTSDDDTEETDALKNTLMDKVSEWDSKEVEKNADLLEELTQTLTPDKDGIAHSSAYKLGNSSSVGKGQFLVKDYFEGKKAGETIVSSIVNGDTEDDVYIDTYTLNDDGTVTLKVYHYSEKK
ncbi:MAG: hypothetical protein K2N51_16540 [Lachnospiraceae bacterium]|nr:hypothetical protein [Lachnospiraceae bacterium]